MTDNAPATARLPWLLLLLVALGPLLAIGVRLLPIDMKPYNFTPVGALALFVSARFGLRSGIAAMFSTMIVSDLALYYGRGDTPFSVPTYACFLLYCALGWAVLKGTRSPVAIGATAISASVAFFLVTNFAAWLEPELGYAGGLSGLLTSYYMGLPFFRGTLTGDLLFTAFYFGLAAVLERKSVPAEGELVAGRGV